MKIYGAITIGPIVETISQVSSPGALWCASGMFSWLAGELCRAISDIPDAEIIAPAYNPSITYKDGIGRWHDRIHFSFSPSPDRDELATDELATILSTLCSQAKKDLAENISNAIGYKNDKNKKTAVVEYINDYIQLSWLVAPEKLAHKKEVQEDGTVVQRNCILSLSDYLDSLELTAGFASDESYSPITRLLTGTANSTNTYIRNCWLMPKSHKIQLKKGRNIREIEDVADPQSLSDGLKKRHYFAVVQSDGDNMGEVLKQCPSDSAVKRFSDMCVKYAGAAAEAVGAFGGLTVYAGGDDLLFLAPLEGKLGEKERNSSILSLCGKITMIFNDHFREFIKEGQLSPSLSFGISINYKKHPLYEALEDARYLLFDVAKKEDKKEDKTKQKNRIALAVHKNSGRSIKLLLPNSMLQGDPMWLLDKLIGKHLAAKDELLHSIIYTIESFRSLYSLCLEQKRDTKHLYLNLFDSLAHDNARGYIEAVRRLGDKITADGRCRAASMSENARENNPKDIEQGNGITADNSCQDSDENDGMSGDYVDVLCSMLRFAKLYTERGDQ